MIRRLEIWKDWILQNQRILKIRSSKDKKIGDLEGHAPDMVKTLSEMSPSRIQNRIHLVPETVPNRCGWPFVTFKSNDRFHGGHGVSSAELPTSLFGGFLEGAFSEDPGFRKTIQMDQNVRPEGVQKWGLKTDGKRGSK